MPRRTALEALERFRRDGAWSRQVLVSLVKKNRLDERDASLASRLFYGTLQNLSLLDYYISCYARGKLEPKVRDVLRLGAYQIAFMDRIPVNAAVSESVKLCRKTGYDRAAGLVNVVLRRMADNQKTLPEVPGKGTPDYLSVKYSHPLWIVEELITLRGYDGAEAVLRADNEDAPVYIHTNTRKTTTESLQNSLKAQPFEDIQDCLMLKGVSIVGLREFKEGLFYVQDPAAHMAVTTAQPEPGMRILDACAAPGGKSFAAAIAMDDRGVVIARDISGAKLNLVMDGADRLGLSCIQCEELDARETKADEFDIVFADVPCSGLGVIRKKPDIRFREKEQLSKLPDLQLELLTAIARAVRPGGRLIYSTCTWQPAENGAVADAFLASHSGFEKRVERTLWPDTDGTDGFYICRMDRKKEI